MKRSMKAAAGALLELAAPRLGYTAIPDNQVSPIPALQRPGHPDWGYRYPSHSIDIDLDSQLSLLTQSLANYIHEFSEAVRDLRFTLWNDLYQAGDAETLYALVRFLKPQRILEIGSGHSTVVTAAACEANAREGSDTDFVAVDPEPRRPLDSLPGLRRHEPIDCRTLPYSRFEELESGDVLFIDTNHVVKRGSEVNWLVLEALPLIRPGVWVHFHDIFLPYDYPFWMYWLQIPTEQYLLQALLMDSCWQVRLALAALFVDRHDQVTRLIPSLREKVPGKPEVETWYPSSFWISRSDKSPAGEPAH
jgi:hypothetical protein